MGRYIVKRILEIIPVLFIITFIVFFLVRVSGDPVNTMLPPEATPEDRQELREALGLNKPYLEQYGIFLSDLVHGRFGISLEIMHEDYIRTARSKGLKERVIVYKHAFKNALIPVVTILALQVPNLIGGSLITETVFAWPGLGQLLIQCINGKDMCVVQACVVFISLITIVANLVADILYALIDPRIRY